MKKLRTFLSMPSSYLFISSSASLWKLFMFNVLQYNTRHYFRVAHMSYSRRLWNSKKNARIHETMRRVLAWFSWDLQRSTSEARSGLWGGPQASFLRGLESPCSGRTGHRHGCCRCSLKDCCCHCKWRLHPSPMVEASASNLASEGRAPRIVVASGHFWKACRATKLLLWSWGWGVAGYQISWIRTKNHFMLTFSQLAPIRD